MELKVCTRCNEAQPLENFSMDNGQKSGLRCKCRWKEDNLKKNNRVDSPIQSSLIFSGGQ